MNAKLRNELLSTLKNRFEKNPRRHGDIEWSVVQSRLDANAKKFAIVHEMENTGGEPDVIGRDEKTGEIVFCDCAPESPSGRRSLCYDRTALDARKENKPSGNAIEMAKTLGIEMLTESEYRALQTLGEFDCKTSSWINTPTNIRALGGALFCDHRYSHVFVYHNGAESYYAARGFRGRLKV